MRTPPGISAARRAASSSPIPLVEPLEPRLLLAADLVISEFMALNNNGALKDQDGAASDWIEINNVSAATVNLAGWGLSDKQSDPFEWRFPAVSIPAGGYLLVFASGKDRAVAGSELHTNFKLSGSGEYLGLVRPDGTVAQEYSPSFPAQVADVSYGLQGTVTQQTLLPEGADATVLVPTSGALGNNWTAPGFDDSTWTLGASGVGYDNVPDVQTGVPVTLLEAGSAAKAFVPTSDIGTAWRSQGYAATGWTSGVTGVGYERSGGYESLIGLDVNSAMYNKNQTAYVRVEFNVTDPTVLTSLTLQMKYDDGFVAYINGQKVVGVNAPTTLAWNSAATTGVEAGSSYVSFDITPYLSSLVTGTNVLAIQGLNSGLTSSDFLIMPRLTGLANVSTYAYADLIGTDVKAAMLGQNASAYVRLPFEVTADTMPDQLTLKMKYDDGFVAYLNGVEVARRNAPAGVIWNSAATANHPDASALVAEVIDISAFASYLHSGSNVLAIQGLNLSAGDADFLILPDLEATWTQQTLETHRFFTVPTPGAANGLGSADLGPIITNVTQFPLLPANNDNITVTANIQPAFHPVTLVTMKYRVMFGSEITLTMYDDGAHGDGLAGDGKYGAVIPASASTPGQMVRWFVSAADAAATARWPLYTETTNSEQYLGTVIQDTSYAATQLPVFQFFLQSPTAADSSTGTRGAVYYMGELYDNVFVRVRGGTINAGMTAGAGLSRKIEFNDDHRFLWDAGLPRVGEINLNDPGPQDDSYLRQQLSFWLYDQAGQPGETTFLMHVRQNGAYMGVRIFHEQADEEMLTREGLDPNGALYQSVGSRVDNLSFEQKTRKWESGMADMQALVNGVNPANPNRHQYVMDNLDLAALVNYLAVDALIEDSDCIQGNYMLYRDTDGSGEWEYIPRDRDLTFGDWVDAGQDWGLNGNGGDRYIANPNYGSSSYPHLSRGWNVLTDAIHDDPVAQQMFYTRLRTLMDEFLKAPGTPYAQLPIEAEIDRLAASLSYESANNLLPPQDPSGGNSFAHGISELKNFYLAGRRGYLYGTIPNTPIPSAQPAIFAGQVVISSMDASPASGNQDEEYVKLTNPNAYAVDISGWSLGGGIDYTFPAGTVIVAGGSMYATPDAKAFRARATGPTGGQGLFVQGGYSGHLDGDGEKIYLLGPAMQTINMASVTPDSVVINEVLAHSNNPEGDWIELYNPTSAPVAIGGWYLSDDLITPLKYQIPAGTVLAAHGYQVFNQRDHFGSLFAFSKDGDEVVLSTPDGTAVDSRNFGATAPDVSLGRYVNSQGKAEFVILSGQTMGAANASPLVGPLVINEIMYHPLDGQDEFIELYNPTAAAVTLYDPAAPAHTWQLSSAVSFTFPAGLQIPAGGYLVVTAADVSTPAGQAAFRAEYNVPSQTQVLGPYSGKLDNAGESVVLSRPGNLDTGTGAFDYIEVDRVTYNDAYPWPTAADGAGASLERMDATAYGNDPGNWISLRASGTPGRPSPLPGDANDDGSVNVVDLGVLAKYYDTASGATWFTADFNGDGAVNVVDLGILARFYDHTVNSPTGAGLDPVGASPAVPQLLMVVSPVDDNKTALSVQLPAGAEPSALGTVGVIAPAPRAEIDILAPTGPASLGNPPAQASASFRWQAPWRTRLVAGLGDDSDAFDLLGGRTLELLRSAGKHVPGQGRHA